MPLKLVEVAINDWRIIRKRQKIVEKLMKMVGNDWLVEYTTTKICSNFLKVKEYCCKLNKTERIRTLFNKNWTI